MSLWGPGLFPCTLPKSPLFSSPLGYIHFSYLPKKKLMGVQLRIGTNYRITRTVWTVFKEYTKEAFFLIDKKQCIDQKRTKVPRYKREPEGKQETAEQAAAKTYQPKNQGPSRQKTSPAPQLEANHSKKLSNPSLLLVSAASTWVASVKE